MENGFRDTAYRLNNYVCKQDEWGFEQIEERTTQLAHRALELWPMITSTHEARTKQQETIPLSEDTSFTAKKITGFQLNDASWTVKSWKEALLNVIRFLLEDHREDLIALAREEKQLVTVGEEAEITNPDWYRQVDPALHVRVGSSTSTKIQLLRTIFDYLGLDQDDLVFEFSAEQDESAAVAQPTPSPYAALTAFAPRLEAGECVREEFFATFKEYADSAPMETLGGTSVEDFLQEKQNPTAKEILAVISVYSMMGIDNGRLAELLRALEAAGRD